MRCAILSLQFREEYSEPIARELDQLIAKIRGFLLTEHNEDGTHVTDVEDAAGLGYNPSEANGHAWHIGPWTFDESGNDEHRIGLRVSYVAGTYNNFNPSGFDKAVVCEFENSGDITITGFMIHERIKRMIIIGNRSASGNDMTISHNSTSSTLSNRIAMANGASLTILAGEYVLFYYDVGSMIWRPIGAAALTAADVWTYATRTLTDKTGFTLTAGSYSVVKLGQQGTVVISAPDSTGSTGISNVTTANCVLQYLGGLNSADTTALPGGRIEQGSTTVSATRVGTADTYTYGFKTTEFF